MTASYMGVRVHLLPVAAYVELIWSGGLTVGLYISARLYRLRVSKSLPMTLIPQRFYDTRNPRVSCNLHKVNAHVVILQLVILPCRSQPGSFGHNARGRQCEDFLPYPPPA